MLLEGHERKAGRDEVSFELALKPVRPHRTLEGNGISHNKVVDYERIFWVASHFVSLVTWA